MLHHGPSHTRIRTIRCLTVLPGSAHPRTLQAPSLHTSPVCQASAYVDERLLSLWCFSQMRSVCEQSNLHVQQRSSHVGTGLASLEGEGVLFNEIFARRGRTCVFQHFRFGIYNTYSSRELSILLLKRKRKFQNRFSTQNVELSGASPLLQEIRVF